MISRSKGVNEAFFVTVQTTRVFISKRQYQNKIPNDGKQKRKLNLFCKWSLFKIRIEQWKAICGKSWSKYKCKNDLDDSTFNSHMGDYIVHIEEYR